MPRLICTLALIAAIAIMGTVCVPFGSFAAPPSGDGTGPQCDQRDKVLRILQQKYGESPVAIGVTHNGGLVEVLTTGNGNTWSIIVTTPQGMSCLVAAGEGWRSEPPGGTDPEAKVRQAPLVLAHGEAQWIADDPKTRHCCGINDCGPVRMYDATVEEVVPGEYLVTLPPNRHPMVPRGDQRLFREGDSNVYPSQRLEPYLCAYAGQLRCFFPEPRGF